MAGRDVDPLVGFQFALDAGDGVEGYFTEIGGIGSENAVVTHKVVTPLAKEVTLQIPGRVEWGEITLKRGLTKDLQLWEWRELVVSGTIVDARKDVTVTMFDRSYELATTWTMVNAWPSKISGPQIASDSNDFTIEEMTLVHEGLKREAMDAMIPAFEPPAGGGAT